MTWNENVQTKYILFSIADIGRYFEKRVARILDCVWFFTLSKGYVGLSTLKISFKRELDLDICSKFSKC